MKITHIAFVLLIVMRVDSYCQTDCRGRNITEGRILTGDSGIVQVFNIIISSDSVEYYDNDLIQRHVLGLGQVKSIEEARGDWGVTGTWIGGLVGAGLGVVSAIALEVKTTSYSNGFIYEQRTIPTWPVYLCTLAGAGVGLLVGREITDWVTVYNGRFACSNAPGIRLDRRTGGTLLSFQLSF